MSQHHEEIKSEQQSVWNKFSGGWKKWDNQNNSFTGKASKAIIDSFELAEDAQILDLASGTGEPGLTLALKVPKGKVVLTDISEDMLAVAKEIAEKKGVTNIEIIAAPSDKVPFPNESFDGLSCRFGFMFFPDIKSTLNECHRVMKPGATITTAVWASPDKNQFATAIMGIISKHVEMPPPNPDAPGFFRCAKPGFLSGLFSEAGFKNVTEKEQPLFFEADSIDTYWKFMTELAAPIVMGMSKADDITKEKIKQEVYEGVQKYFKDGRLAVPACAIIISGVK